MFKFVQSLGSATAFFYGKFTDGKKYFLFILQTNWALQVFSSFYVIFSEAKDQFFQFVYSACLGFEIHMAR